MRSLGARRKTANWIRFVVLAAGVLATSGTAFYFETTVNAADADRATDHKALSSTSFSLPLFFEPNQGQTDPQVKFLARGRGYGLFLTADEAVLKLQPAAAGGQHSDRGSQNGSSWVIRMRLDRANSSSRVSGASPLPGKSNYFIGDDPSKWRQNIPQFAHVQYESVYRGVDLVYYGNQGELEYDFRVAPGADPNQIVLDFQGASARIVSGSASGNSSDSGDLILSTAIGDIRFHAPRIYQPAVPALGKTSGNPEKEIAGGFRQLPNNKIGFVIGDYDHSRELVIDPILTYSTYIGGTGGNENYVQVAVDSSLLIYVAGSTTSPNFPVNAGSTPPMTPDQLSGPQNIFIAVINPSLQPPQYTGTPSPQLVYATYLGGSGSDTLGGLAVDSNSGIYVAGTTTSSNFPTTSNAFQTNTDVAADFPGSHGFLSKVALTGTAGSLAYSLTYSTLLAGNGYDIVAGVAVDINQNAYLSGNTTSTNAIGNGFPANANGYQLASNSPGNPQFFASKINTNGGGQQSMLYSTFFGGGYPDVAIAGLCTPSNLVFPCGGVAVDPSGNMYITSTTNMLPVQGPNGEVPFPLLNAWQPCLNQGSSTATCTSNSPTTMTDAFVAKFNPNFDGPSSLIFATYLGGAGSETGNAIAVDASGNAFVTGSANSPTCTSCTTPGSWVGPGAFQTEGYRGTPPNPNAFIAELGNSNGGVYPLTYLTYLGGPGPDVGNAITVSSVDTAFVAGSTSGGFSPTNPIQPNPPISSYNGAYGGGGDAFVAAISTTTQQTDVFQASVAQGDFVTFLGGSGPDEGTGIAIDIYGATYVAGTTGSVNFPVSASPASALQGTFNATSTDAFVSKLGALSNLTVTTASASPAPSPAAVGVPIAFTFNITNTGPDPASSVNFYATVLPNTGLASLSSPPTGTLTAGTGSCSTAEGQNEIVPCTISTLGVSTTPASVQINVTTNNTTNPVVTQVTVSGTASANGSSTQINSPAQVVNIVDFTISASTPTPIITAGQAATIPVTFCPSVPSLGYSANIMPSDSISPTMDTASTPTFAPTPVVLTGSACASTTLTIPTVVRPVTVGSIWRGGSFYASWLPIVGLSLMGLGIGASRKRRRRWLIGMVLGIIAGVIILLPGCSSPSTPNTTPAGTQAGIYNITIVGASSLATGASHSTTVQLRVD